MKGLNGWMLALAGMIGLLGATSARAEPEWFAIDPVHTRVLFFVDHARFARSIGLFRPVEGGLWFDDEDWSKGRVELCISLDHLDMGDRKWEDALRRSDFFDASRHPDLCFASNRVERLDQEKGRLHGEITIRGTKRPAVFDFTVNDLRRFSLTMKRRLGVSATATLSRSEFGMTRDKTLIGDTIEVIIELEAQIADPPSGASPSAAPATKQ